MIVFFDTETTGLPNWKNPEVNTPRMVQLGLIVTDSYGRIMRTLGVIFKSEGYSISKELSDIHGITDEIALVYGMGRTNEFFWMLSDIFHNAEVIVAHNYSFDKIILNGEFALAGIGKLDDSKAFCTKEHSMEVCKLSFSSSSSYGNKFLNKQRYKWPKLSEAYKFLFNEDLKGAHDALTDVRATMRIYFELKNRQSFPGL
jgi:DNA polymerase-3 subunit epsilon